MSASRSRSCRRASRARPRTTTSSRRSMSTSSRGRSPCASAPAAYAMQAGDYVCFPAGQKAGHCLVNEGVAPCRYVIVGERNPNEVAVYTDSNKVLVRALGRRAIYDLGGAGAAIGTARTPGCRRGKARRSSAARSLEPPVTAEAADLVASTWHGKRRVRARARVFGGRSKHLTYAAVGRDYHVGMLIEAPAPGRRLCADALSHAGGGARADPRRTGDAAPRRGAPRDAGRATMSASRPAGRSAIPS